MASEPITLFAKVPNQEHALKVLQEISPKLEVVSEGDIWKKAIVTCGKYPLENNLKISHDPSYYTGRNWVVQMDGMRNYFSRFPETPERQRVLDLTRQFGFALGTITDTDFDENDYRLRLISILASELDAVWFTPTSLRDSYGRVLFSIVEKEIDSSARWPTYA